MNGAPTANDKSWQDWKNNDEKVLIAQTKHLVNNLSSFYIDNHLFH